MFIKIGIFIVLITTIIVNLNNKKEDAQENDSDSFFLQESKADGKPECNYWFEKTSPVIKLKISDKPFKNKDDCLKHTEYSLLLTQYELKQETECHLVNKNKITFFIYCPSKVSWEDKAAFVRNQLKQSKAKIVLINMFDNKNKTPWDYKELSKMSDRDIDNHQIALGIFNKHKRSSEFECKINNKWINCLKLLYPEQKIDKQYVGEQYLSN